jgi:L-lactate dehydrogenase complex protein LldG
MQREAVLHKVRTALGRSAGQDPGEPPPVRIRIPEMERDERVRRFCASLEALAGKTYVASSIEDARTHVANAIAGSTAVASNSRFLEECGIASLPGVQTGITDREELRGICASAGVGITSADYALADTGTLVMLSSPGEARMISLLPPRHIAVIRRDSLLTSLDELLTVIPQPAEATSAMVLITGPSRTADIELTLVRGVHGPASIHVVIVQESGLD